MGGKLSPSFLFVVLFQCRWENETLLISVKFTVFVVSLHVWEKFGDFDMLLMRWFIQSVRQQANPNYESKDWEKQEQLSQNLWAKWIRCRDLNQKQQGYC